MGVTISVAAPPSGLTGLFAESRTLDFYWVDVEGGAATLIVIPPVSQSSSMQDRTWSAMCPGSTGSPHRSLG